MGFYLSKPIKTKVNDFKENESFAVATSEMQGWRRDMEDAHLLRLSDNTKNSISLFGVFDGHGGPAVSKWVARHFIDTLDKSIEDMTEKFKSGKLQSRITLPSDAIAITAEALENCFFSLDDQLSIDKQCAKELRVLQAASDRRKNIDLLNHGIDEMCNDYLLNKIVRPIKWVIEQADGSPGSKEMAKAKTDSCLNFDKIYEEELEKDTDATDLKMPYDPKNCGCTANVGAVVYDPTPHLIIANVGDSRAIVIRNGKAIGMSQDHKPLQVREILRIKKAGSYVANGRVDGNLNLSRTIGDLIYKQNTRVEQKAQSISALPDLTILELKKEDEFVVLACDGVWDVLSNQTCASLVINYWEEAVQKLSAADKALLYSGDGQGLAQDICKEVGDKILDACLAESPYENQQMMGIGCDNMTILVARLTDKFRATLDSAEDVADVQESLILYGTEAEKANYGLTRIVSSEDNDSG